MRLAARFSGCRCIHQGGALVVRAMRRFRNEAEQEQVEHVLTSYEAGSFLVDRFGAGLIIDRDLCAGGSSRKYGDTSAMLISRFDVLRAHRPGTNLCGGIADAEHPFVQTCARSSRWRSWYQTVEFDLQSRLRDDACLAGGQGFDTIKSLPYIVGSNP